MKKSIVILYFVDSEESEQSEKSALSVYDVFGQKISKLCPLSETNYISILSNYSRFNTIFFLATHGGMGENGVLQRFLETNHFTYTHSRAETCGILVDKNETKKIYKFLNIPTPPWVCGVDHFDFDSSDKKVLLKPRYGGSKIGIKIIDKEDIVSNRNYIYERIIYGFFELSVIVMRDQDKIITLCPILRRRDTNRIGVLVDSDEIVDTNILKMCEQYAKMIFEYLNCYGVTKTDFLLDNDNNIFAIETDAIPSMTVNSASARAASKFGIKYRDFIYKILNNAF